MELKDMPQWYKGLYRPRGRAKEYAEFAIEPYGKSCEHGCRYCYAPKIAKTTREKFQTVKPDFRILDKVKADLDEWADSIRPYHIQLGFFCDPYQSVEMEHKLTRQLIKLLHSYDMKVQILTKNKNVLRDLPILRPDDKVGCTLTFDNPVDSLKWESGASLPEARLEVFFQAKHKYGITTWASLEPIIYPKQSITMIERTDGTVDLFKIGHTNHIEDFEPELQEIVSRIDWPVDGKKIIAAAKKTGAEVYIKKDLREVLGL